MQTSLHTHRKSLISCMAGMLMLLSLPYTGKAQTTITNGSTAICTNYAADGITPYYQTLNTISFSETNTGDFGHAGMYTVNVTLTAGAGWEFHAAHNPSISFSPGGNIANLAITSFTSSALSFTVFGENTDMLDNINISGLQARQASTLSGAGSVILSLAGGSGSMAGLTGGETVATLSPLAPSIGSTATPLTGVSSTTPCAGDNVDFSATANSAFQPVYQWQVNGSNVAGATSNTYSTATLDDADEVTVTVFDHTCISAATATSSAITMTVRPLPTPITGTVTICANNSTALNSTPASGTWSSSFHTVATINASTGLMEAVASGNATISYQAPNGCYTAVDITVNPLPSIIDGNMETCMGNSETLTNDDLGGTWTSSTTSVATIGTNGTVTAAMGGTTTITYTIATGCQRTSVFTVNTLPVAFNVTGSGSYCADGTGLAVGLSNTAIGYTYDLYNGSTLVGSISGDGSAGTFGTYTTAATYTAIATNDNTGCLNNMTGDATITITALATPSVTITNTPNDTVCTGTTVTFAATPANGGTTPIYTWSVNGNPMGTGDTYNYTPANGDVVSVVLTTNVLCPSTPTANDDLAMVVYSNETPAVTINTSLTTICQHTPVTFSIATSAHGGTAPVYTWYIGGVSTGITSSSYTYQPTDNDVVSVKLHSNYRCPTANDVASNNVTMNVDSVYLPTVTITTNTGLEMTAGETVTFTAHVTKAGTATPRYQWYVNNGAINNATSATYTSSTIKDNDSVSCWVRAAGVCNASTPSFNSVRMKYVGVTFVHTAFNDANVRLVPNPNNGIFYVKGSLNTDMDTEVQMEVTNLMGQVVYTGNYVAKNGNMDVQVQPGSILANGMYLLSLRADTDGQTFHFVVAQ